MYVSKPILRQNLDGIERLRITIWNLLLLVTELDENQKLLIMAMRIQDCTDTLPLGRRHFGGQAAQNELKWHRGELVPSRGAKPSSPKAKGTGGLSSSREASPSEGFPSHGSSLGAH